MTEGQIIFGLVTAAGLIIGAVVGIYGLMWNRSSAHKVEINALHERINRLRGDHDAYKLTVSEKYASTTLLRETEQRLARSLEALDKRLDELPRYIALALADALAERDGVRPRRRPSAGE